jgi:hypothetical protein
MLVYARLSATSCIKEMTKRRQKAIVTENIKMKSDKGFTGSHTLTDLAA